MSSFRLFLDHRIANSGQAYFNATGQFYPSTSNRQGVYSYACPYRSLVKDSSVAGATVMTGVYLNGVFVTPGTSGLQEINHYRGTLDFTGQLPANTRITGSFSVKEINVELTTKLEDELIFETKFFPRPKYGQSLTGLPFDGYSVPSVFLKKKSATVQPFSIGGTDLSVINVRAVVIADSEYILDAVGSILKDTYYRRFESITSLPFSARGGYTGTTYSYTGIVSGEHSRTGPIIQGVNEARVIAGGAEDSLKNKLYASFIDFKITQTRDH